jgi:hypothetical protein
MAGMELQYGTLQLICTVRLTSIYLEFLNIENLCWSPLRYCRAGQKSKKSYLGHGLGMITDQDILGHSLVILLKCLSCVK